MSLYAIGDLHLHFGSELTIGHPQLKDRAWKNHEEKFRKNCAKLLNADDTLVVLGDPSWGKNLDACEPDLQYIRTCADELAESLRGVIEWDKPLREARYG